MNAGDILQQVDGLTHDKLTYFVRAGYLNPKKIKTYDMKTKSAFKRAENEFKDPQIALWR